MKNKIITIIFKVFFPIILATTVSLFTDFNIYTSLLKPPFSPPKIIFPIVWIILYLIMGYSYYIISYEKKDLKVTILYYSQLFFNLIWSILFFNLNLFLISVIDILIIIIILINMIYEFYMIKKISGLLNLPYLFWLLFAFYLSLGVYILN